MPKAARNWFDLGGESYARYRPDYPDEMAAFLAGIAPDRRLAVDVGCGNGQLTRLLADQFGTVIGVDPSADQLASAPSHERIRYACAPAEQLPVEDRSASLVTAAQAAHWFDLPRFYEEVRRIAAPKAIVALVTYRMPEVDAELRERFQRFYRDEVGPYWPEKGRAVDEAYAGFDFPFRERPFPPLFISRDWTAAEFIGFTTTWSVMRRLRADGRDDILEGFADDILGLWGDAERTRPFRWQISMRLGEVVG